MSHLKNQIKLLEILGLRQWLFWNTDKKIRAEWVSGRVLYKR